MAGEYFISSIALAFTAPESNLRKVCLLCLLTLTFIEIRLLSFLSGPELLRGVLAFSCFVKLLHFIGLFLILPVEMDQLAPQPSDSPLARFGAAFNCVTGTRGIRTPWEVKPRRSCAALPRGHYTAKCLLVLVWRYMALDLLNFGGVRYFQREWPGALAAGTEFLGPGSTKEQLIARFPLSCLLVANLRLLFAAIYEVVSLVFVLLNVSSPRDWPPLFGSVGELQEFRIRDFWVHYWHGLLRWPLVTISGVVQRRVLTASSRAQRVIQLFLVFSMSGVLHMLSAVYAGVPDNLGAIFLFFVGNAAAIVVEDACRPRPSRNARRRWDRPLGFLGMLAWFYVSAPWFAYTALRLPVETNELMPFSFVEAFGSRVMMGVVVSGWAIWTMTGGGTV
ncbi:membrane bound O-acyl transferase family-domain-containing protein [Aspergillus falconensis]